MSKKISALTVFTLGLALLGGLGCTKPPALDAEQVAAYSAQFALDEEPDGIQTVVDVRATLLGDSESDHDDHDHDGDGIPDHDAADHDAADHEDEEEDHDHDGDGQSDHDPVDHDGEADHAVEDHSHGPLSHSGAMEPQDVVMVGHVGGLANPWAGAQPEYPFAKTQAVFFLADPQAVVENEEAGHKHAPGEECPFCAAHAADNATKVAMVQFVDKKGDVLPMGVRSFFDVNEQDTVVVSGKARVTEGGILVVIAEGLYVRK